MEEQKTDLQDLISMLIIEAGKNRKIITGLKSILIKNKLYDIASQLREFEKLAYPMPKDAEEKYIQAEKFSTALRMAGLAPDLKASFIVMSVYEKYTTMRGNFDLDTATTIQFEADEIFGKE